MQRHRYRMVENCIFEEIRSTVNIDVRGLRKLMKSFSVILLQVLQNGAQTFGMNKDDYWIYLVSRVVSKRQRHI